MRFAARSRPPGGIASQLMLGDCLRIGVAQRDVDGATEALGRTDALGRTFPGA